MGPLMRVDLTTPLKPGAKTEFSIDFAFNIVEEDAVKEDKNYCVLAFSNLGELVMPIILELTFEDSSTENLYIPAEIWLRTPKAVNKMVFTNKNKVLAGVTVGPRWETADVNVDNTHYPRKIIPSRIESYKSKP